MSQWHNILPVWVIFLIADNTVAIDDVRRSGDKESTATIMDSPLFSALVCWTHTAASSSEGCTLIGDMFSFSISLWSVERGQSYLK